ncbi:hypothetical protein Hanom_Chr14g01270781 [Helianthus anomalus]
MAQAMMQDENQRQLEVELFHNQARYLLDPPAEYVVMFGSLITGLNNCPITHALRAEPVICNNCINTFWNTAKKKEVIVTEAIIREVLQFGDQQHFPTSFENNRVLAALRRMRYEGSYPNMLKKLFPPYWRLLVHFFLQCIAESKGGYDQLNKT